MTQININLPPNIGQRDFDEWISQLTQYIRDNVGVVGHSALGKPNIVTLSDYADNAAAVSAGLKVGDLYRSTDSVCVVHA
jgi:predicted alpha/beta hydrolase family esterase